MNPNSKFDLYMYAFTVAMNDWPTIYMTKPRWKNDIFTSKSRSERCVMSIFNRTSWTFNKYKSIVGSEYIILLNF